MKDEMGLNVSEHATAPAARDSVYFCFLFVFPERSPSRSRTSSYFCSDRWPMHESLSQPKAQDVHIGNNSMKVRILATAGTHVDIRVIENPRLIYVYYSTRTFLRKA